MLSNLFVYSENKYILIFSFYMSKHSHVLHHIEREKNVMFVIKIRKVSITMKEFSEGKEFCLLHSLLCLLALEQCLVHDSFKYLLNENHFSLFKSTF